jgi:hypothetical protein
MDRQLGTGKPVVGGSRCLDARTVRRYVKVGDVLDLRRAAVTAASLSDVIRLLLLHEYGGVWADATLYCNSPLDHWLNPFLGSGFFAFANPGPDRRLAAWFIASAENNDLCAMRTNSTVRHRQDRTQTEGYPDGRLGITTSPLVGGGGNI